MNHLRNEKGISLVEVLAVFVISALIVMMIINIQVFTQKQFKEQSGQAKNVTDITIAMKVITKDFRTHELMPLTDEEVRQISFENGNSYYFENNILYRNGGPYIYEVANFYVKKDDEFDGLYTIYIESLTGQKLETEIAVRGGDSS